MEPSKRAYDVLSQRLSNENFQTGVSTFADFWVIFKAFSAESFGCPREDCRDGILFETASPEGEGQERYWINVVRQFIIVDEDAVDSEDGGYSHMEQLICEFSFPPSLEQRASEFERECIWSFEFETDFEKFFMAIEALPLFTAIQSVPADLTLSHTEV